MSRVFHYVYKIIFETGHIYYGSRSCECLPEEDPYMGSPYTHKQYWEDYKYSKTIISDDFLNRDDATSFEDFCIDLQWLKNKALSLNAHNRGGSKFHTQGVKFSEEFCEKVRKRCEKPFQIVSPEGEVIDGINLRQFCRDKNLNVANTLKVIQNRSLHSKGWTASLLHRKLYLSYYQSRGISFATNKKHWRVTLPKKDGGKVWIFKAEGEAIKFRDEYELKNNYKFRVISKTWKEKFNAELV